MKQPIQQSLPAGGQAALGQRGDELSRQRGFSQSASSALHRKRDAAGELLPAREPENIPPGASFTAPVFLPSPAQSRHALL